MTFHCASTIERETHEVCISQVSPDKCDNQQCEVRVSSQQRHETRVSKPKRESRVCSTERELRIFEPYVIETCKVNIRSPMAKVRKDLKSPHSQRLEVGLFDPPSNGSKGLLDQEEECSSNHSTMLL